MWAKGRCASNQLALTMIISPWSIFVNKDNKKSRISPAL
jgi:hypothetical protein